MEGAARRNASLYATNSEYFRAEGKRQEFTTNAEDEEEQDSDIPNVMIGDRMDTDIVAGTEAGMRTILVLSGVTRRDQVERFPYRPSLVVDSVADIQP